MTGCKVRAKMSARHTREIRCSCGRSTSRETADVAGVGGCHCSKLCSSLLSILPPTATDPSLRTVTGRDGDKHTPALRLTPALVL